MAVLAASLMGCAAGDDTVPRQTAGGNAEHGRQLLQVYGCTNCHSIPGVSAGIATIAPPLDGWAGRRFIAGLIPNNPVNLQQWIREPQSIHPRTAMPDLGVEADEALHMATYLYTLTEIGQ